MLFGTEIPMYDLLRPAFVVLYFGGLIAMTITMFNAESVMAAHNRKLPASLPDENRFTFGGGLITWWANGLQIVFIAIVVILFLGQTTLGVEAWVALYVVGNVIPVMVNLERESGEKGLTMNGVPFVSVR